MPRSSKRPKIDINDAVELTQLVMRARADAEILRRDISILATHVLGHKERMDKVQDEMNKLIVKLQAATPPAPKAAYNKAERAILERVPAKKGGWKQTKPTRGKAQKSTLPKRIARRREPVKGVH